MDLNNLSVGSRIAIIGFLFTVVFSAYCIKKAGAGAQQSVSIAEVRQAGHIYLSKYYKL